MSASPNKRDDSPAPPNKPTVILLLRTAGDTTWRMFVPTIGCTVLGVIGDRAYGTKPWLTIAAIAAGAALAALLVRAQFKKVEY